jgi:hypothetical protein
MVIRVIKNLSRPAFIHIDNGFLSHSSAILIRIIGNKNYFTVKINCDAAVDSIQKSMGLGIIARDERGKFLEAISKKQYIEIEPVAIHAVMSCHELNFHYVIFEGDALEVVQAVNSASICNSSYGH